MSQHKEQQGYLTFAKNTKDVDYLRLAYAQALNIKATQKYNSYAVVVNSETEKLITDTHRQVFDYIIVAESTGPFDAEALAFWLTPFKETIKLEADLLFTRSIDHWWDSFRLRDVFLSTGCRNYQQQISTTRKYRKLFDDNYLPDVYNGLMYFRFSQTAANFFTLARQIFDQWETVKTSLVQCDVDASTDIVFALAAQIIGPELCSVPTMDFINFVHMKPAVNDHPEEYSFDEVYNNEFSDGMIRINNINQLHPLHYHEKNFITDEMIEYYGSRISQST